jgi:hypothetical protein
VTSAARLLGSTAPEPHRSRKFPRSPSDNSAN